MKIENHGSFCNIYSNDGMSFGTCVADIAVKEIEKAGGDPEKYPKFIEEMRKQDQNNPNFIFKINPCCEFLFETDKYPEIFREVSRQKDEGKLS